MRFDAAAAAARDGRPYHNAYVWIFRLRGGRAAGVTAFLDLAPYDRVVRDVAPPREAGAASRLRTHRTLACPSATG